MRKGRNGRRPPRGWPLSLTKISPDSEVEKAEKKLTDGDQIPLLTLSGGRLSEFGGPEAAVAYRIWVHPNGDSYVYEADTLEEVKAEVKRADIPQNPLEDPIAVVWDSYYHDFREVVID